MLLGALGESRESSPPVTREDAATAPEQENPQPYSMIWPVRPLCPRISSRNCAETARPFLRDWARSYGPMACTTEATGMSTSTNGLTTPPLALRRRCQYASCSRPGVPVATQTQKAIQLQPRYRIDPFEPWDSSSLQRCGQHGPGAAIGTSYLTPSISEMLVMNVLQLIQNDNSERASRQTCQAISASTRILQKI